MKAVSRNFNRPQRYCSLKLMGAPSPIFPIWNFLLFKYWKVREKSDHFSSSGDEIFNFSAFSNAKCSNFKKRGKIVEKS